ncbi:MAG: preprotein translocase subunit SecG [Desulfovibrio sp.]|nr:preprotein translocase subunit SecG [Desulfovibrio sp.]
MQTLILTLHLIVCFLLVVLILLQSGKEGMGVIFGGGNSSVFGSTGAGGILAKLTALMGVIFVITSLSYTYVTSSRPESESQILDVRIEDIPPPEKESSTTQSPAPAATQSPAPEQKTTAPDTTSPQTPAENQTSASPAAPESASPSATDSSAPQPGASTSDSQKPTDSAPPETK